MEGGAGIIRIYERSLCQSYAGAYRAGIKIGEAETREDALKQVEAMTEAGEIA